MTDTPVAAAPLEEERFRPGEGGPLIAYEHWHRYAVAARALKSGRVLDVASGEGYGARFLRKLGFEVVAVDIDPLCLVGMAPGARARAEALPFADGTFDAVLCFEALEHVEDPQRVAAELARVTAQDGVLLLSTPDRDVYRDRMGQRNPFHPSELRKDELVELLARNWPEVSLFAQSIWAGSWMSRVGSDRSDGAARFWPVSVEDLGLAARFPDAEPFADPRPGRQPDPPAAPWCAPGDERFPVPVYYLAVASRLRSRLTSTVDRIGDASVLHDAQQRLIGDYLQAMTAVALRDRHLDDFGRHTRALEEEHRHALATLEQTVENQRAALEQREQQWRADRARVETLSREIEEMRRRGEKEAGRSRELARENEGLRSKLARPSAPWIRAWQRLRRAP